MRIKTNFGAYENCWLAVGRYVSDDSLAIMIYNPDDYIARITTCLNDPMIMNDEAYLDENNCPWAADFVKEYHLGEHTGETRKSGFCEYPLYRFFPEELKKYAKEGILA